MRGTTEQDQTAKERCLAILRTGRALDAIYADGWRIQPGDTDAPIRDDADYVRRRAHTFDQAASWIWTLVDRHTTFRVAPERVTHSEGNAWTEWLIVTEVPKKLQGEHRV